MKYLINIGDIVREVCIDENDSVATIDGKPVKLDYTRLKGNKIHSLLADGTGYEFEIIRSNGGFDIWVAGNQIRADVSDEKTERFKKLMGSAVGARKASTLKAPMPGLVLKVEVEPGQHVKKGDGLVIIEAMKMENELKAHAPGLIKEIKVQAGQPVEKNQILLVFE